MMADNDNDHEIFLDRCETEKVRMALATGMDGNAAGNDGQTALMLAASR